MGQVSWRLEEGYWVCYVDGKEAFSVLEKEMNGTADEKGGIEPAKEYYARLYLTPA